MMQNNLKEFWVKYEHKIILLVGLLLVAAISFEFGYLQGGSAKIAPIVIEKPSQEPKISPESPVDAIMGQNTTANQKAPAEDNLNLLKNCTFVGSKNSDKYHVPTCSFAKRIKPENLVCFKSAEEVLAQGRAGDKGCIK